MFLDYAGLAFEDVVVDWGRAIRLPADKADYLDRDVVIPIDQRGRTFIPFPQVWEQDFDNITVHNFLDYANDPGVQGNLAQLFENRFVFIGDFSQGATDIGPTPLENRVPLIAIVAVILTAAALLKSPWFLYSTGGLILVAILALTRQQMLQFTLVPVATIGGSFLAIFAGLASGLHVAVSREQRFIRTTFARFLPEPVIRELLAHPEKLKLGGVKQVVTILFSDIQGFTTISEQLSPKQLVRVVNEYFSAMTEIIVEAGGIIDKYAGTSRALETSGAS